MESIGGAADAACVILVLVCGRFNILKYNNSFNFTTCDENEAIKLLSNNTSI